MIDRQAIINAFAKTAHPGDDALCDCDCEDCQWEIARFKNKKWSRLTSSDFGAEDGGADVSFLTLEGFYYFLPGFLLLLADNPGNGSLWGQIVSRLVVSDQASDEKRERVRKLVTRITPAQRAVLLSVANHSEVATALTTTMFQALVGTLQDGRVSPYSLTAVQQEMDTFLRQFRNPRTSM